MGWDYGIVNKEGYKFDIIENQWATPTISLQGNTISTSMVDGVSKYKVYADGTYIGYIDSNNVWHRESQDIVSGSPNSVQLQQGIMFAYGYFGYIPSSVFEFINPAIPQYYILYAELDRSRIPNTCKIKVKNNQSSKNIENTFRQDILSKFRTGVFQLPLYMVKVDVNGVQDITDLRVLRDKIKDVYTVSLTNNIYGYIPDSVHAVTQLGGDRSQKIATTRFVDREISNSLL